jgi:hypothetical protein
MTDEQKAVDERLHQAQQLLSQTRLPGAGAGELMQICIHLQAVGVTIQQARDLLAGKPPGGAPPK